MLWIGPTSSVFDITTYLLLYFIICPFVAGGAFGDAAVNTALFISIFHAGWFTESLWSQTLVIHMIRTPKIPFIQSRASAAVIIFTCLGIGIGTALPYTSLGLQLGMSPLPALYFFWLALTLMGYMTFVTVLKKAYIRRYGEFL